MRRILWWTLLALSLSANVAVAAMALRGGPRGVPAEPPLFAKVALDDDQRARILALRERLLVDRAAQAERLATLRGELAAVVSREPTDPRAVDEALARIEAGQSAFQRRVVDHVLAVREVLRPEQRPAFAALVGRFMRQGGPLDATSAVAAPGGDR